GVPRSPRLEKARRVLRVPRARRSPLAARLEQRPYASAEPRSERGRRHRTKVARQSREREGLRNLVAEQACGRVDRACHQGADRLEVAPHEGIACCRNDRLALDEKMLESLAQLAWREAARGGALERRYELDRGARPPGDGGGERRL